MNMMKMFDPNQSGTLSDREMQQVMLKTQLDKKACAQVWDLANPQRESTFSKSMFLIAMHLMYKKRQDPNIQFPDRVPQELFVTAEAKGDPSLASVQPAPAPAPTSVAPSLDLSDGLGGLGDMSSLSAALPVKQPTPRQASPRAMGGGGAGVSDSDLEARIVQR